MASLKQIAANQANSLRSTGPRSVAGKEAARRNSMTHGLTGRGVVIAGEDEEEVGRRAAAFEARLNPAGDPLGAMLVRQVAIASVRSERAYRHETALAAERMRRAASVYEDGRQVLAAELLAELEVDPATTRRRLLAAPEGVDALIGRLRTLQEKAEPRPGSDWDLDDGAALDRCLGERPGQAPLKRAAMLTRGIVYDAWDGVDLGGIADQDSEARSRWGIGQIHALIVAEIASLEAHRAGLNSDRAVKGRAEAAERSVIDLGKEGIELRRYAGAAERTILRFLKELKDFHLVARAEVEPLAPAAPAPTEATPIPTVAARVAPAAPAPQSPVRERLRAEMASFCAAASGLPGMAILDADRPSFVPIAAGLPPIRPISPASGSASAS